MLAVFLIQFTVVSYPTELPDYIYLRQIQVNAV